MLTFEEVISRLNQQTRQNIEGSDTEGDATSPSKVYGGMLAREVAQAATETLATVDTLLDPPGDLRGLLQQIIATASALRDEPLSNAAVGDWRERILQFANTMEGSPAARDSLDMLADRLLHHLFPRFNRRPGR